jgi:hypothetical protein
VIKEFEEAAVEDDARRIAMTPFDRHLSAERKSWHARLTFDKSPAL